MRLNNKRAMDMALAGVGLLLLSPLLAIIAVSVRVRLGSPVIFRQERTGYQGRSFVMFKFRTMTDAYDAKGVALPDAQRLSPFGARLRAMSLDELPELWNVLLGHMSLVGPRPLPVAYLPRYTENEWRRHEVRPGITGWAQVNGRNTIEWEERLQMDVWYVDHRSFWLDLRILVRTAGKVLSRSGVTADGEATMRELRPELAVPNDSGQPRVPALRQPCSRQRGHW